MTRMAVEQISNLYMPIGLLTYRLAQVLRYSLLVREVWGSILS